MSDAHSSTAALAFGQPRVRLALRPSFEFYPSELGGKALQIQYSFPPSLQPLPKYTSFVALIMMPFTILKKNIGLQKMET